MKCLSMMQPWAWLLLQPDLKDVENRDRGSYYRGPCLIQASKKYDNEALPWIKEIFGSFVIERIPQFLPIGAIVGRVDFTAMMIKGAPNYQHLPEYSSSWFTGPYGYVRKNPVMFDKPIPYRGMPSLFFEVPCTPQVPCCVRRDEYNGFASGPLKFTCPMHCRCHD